MQTQDKDVLASKTNCKLGSNALFVMGRGQLLALGCLSLLFFVQITTCQKADCDRTRFGAPARKDCITLFAKLPDVRDTSARVFDEEDLKQDDHESWPGVQNPCE